MTRGHARCFLCGLSAREGALIRAGQLWACADDEACDERRAKRARDRDASKTEAGK
jgi:hypothetical protein